METLQKIAKLNDQIEAVPSFKGELPGWTTHTSTILCLILGAEHTIVLQYNRISYSPDFAPASYFYPQHVQLRSGTWCL
ncbi:hypothetical protein ABH939_002626 [Rhodococcus sp. 27YEA6]